MASGQLGGEPCLPAGWGVPAEAGCGLGQRARALRHHNLGAPGPPLDCSCGNLSAFSRRGPGAVPAWTLVVWKPVAWWPRPPTPFIDGATGWWLPWLPAACSCGGLRPSAWWPRWRSAQLCFRRSSWLVTQPTAFGGAIARCATGLVLTSATGLNPSICAYLRLLCALSGAPEWLSFRGRPGENWVLSAQRAVGSGGPGHPHGQPSRAWAAGGGCSMQEPGLLAVRCLDANIPVMTKVPPLDCLCPCQAGCWVIGFSAPRSPHLEALVSLFVTEIELWLLAPISGRRRTGWAYLPPRL